MPLLTQAYTDDKKLKVSENDTTLKYLNGGLIEGAGISLTELNDGGNETLSVANTDTGSGAVSGHESSYDHTLLHSPVSVLDSASVDFTLTGQQVTAAVLPAGVDHNSLNNLTVGDPHTQYQKESDFTAGSILFRGASAITEDNANLLWDNVNKRIGKGTVTPEIDLHIKNDVNTLMGFLIENNSTGISAIIQNRLRNSSNALAYYGITGPNFNAGASTYAINNGVAYVGSFNSKFAILTQGANDITFYTGGLALANLRAVILSTGNFGINTTAPARKLEVLDTTNPQERWTHTAGSVYGEVQATSNGYLEFNATGNRILLGKDDSDKTYWGSGYDFSAYYDGTNAHLKTDEVAASNLSITTGTDKSLILENGLLALKETTTPTAVADYGRVYTKSDNKLYFQDGAGTEHEIQFV